MIKVILRAKSRQGREALEQHYNESRALKLGITQKLISKEPYTLQVTLSKHLSAILKEEHIRLGITEAMKKNGAKEVIDYNIEVLK